MAVLGFFRYRDDKIRDAKRTELVRVHEQIAGTAPAGQGGRGAPKPTDPEVIRTKEDAKKRQDRIVNEIAALEKGRSSTRDFMQVILSLLLTVVSLCVILLKRYPPKDKHWAYGTIGTVLGFWIHF